ncbi:MAG: hypothetical protein ABIY55_21250 [Kofleriaceae bacterium]
MNKLVIATLIAAAASSAACTATVTPIDPPIDPPDTSAVITANWQFDHFADGTERGCPTDYQTATVYWQPWNPVTGRLTGQPITDQFNCAAMHGTTAPLDGVFLVWIQIESDDGSRIYAKSEQSYIDTIDGDRSLELKILDDAGRFFLSWELRDKATGASLTCAQASDGGGAVKVETVATIVGTDFMLADRFPCEHGFGTTDPLLADTYTVSVDAAISSGAIGTAPALTNVVVSSPNGLTDLGHIMIPID